MKPFKCFSSGAAVAALGGAGGTDGRAKPLDRAWTASGSRKAVAASRRAFHAPRQMTFGGTAPLPTFAPPQPERRPETDEYGWLEPESAAAPPSAQPRDNAAEYDAWTPETGESVSAPAVTRSSVAEGELLIEDDSRWRQTEAKPRPPGSAVDDAELLRRCEAWHLRAIHQPQPSALMRAIKAGGCNALSGGFKCVICGPKGPALTGVSAYYRPHSGRILLCADRLNSEAEVAAALTHELVHAYDHCRRGLRIPLVRTSVPWALDCPTEACSEVRAFSMSNYADAPPHVDKRSLVYRSALASMLNNASSQCGGGDRCATALATVFDLCAADSAPFNEEGRQAERRGKFPAMDLPAVPPPPPPNSV